MAHHGGEGSFPRGLAGLDVHGCGVHSQPEQFFRRMAGTSPLPADVLRHRARRAPSRPRLYHPPNFLPDLRPHACRCPPASSRVLRSASSRPTTACTPPWPSRPCTPSWPPTQVRLTLCVWVCWFARHTRKLLACLVQLKYDASCAGMRAAALGPLTPNPPSPTIHTPQTGSSCTALRAVGALCVLCWPLERLRPCMWLWRTGWAWRLPWSLISATTCE